MGLSEDRIAQNDTIAVSTASVVLFNADTERSFLYVYNGTAGSVLTVHLGEGLAVAGEGAVLNYGQGFLMSDDSGSRAWRGAISAIANQATTVSRQAITRGGY